jgi:hypothetical protein
VTWYYLEDNRGWRAQIATRESAAAHARAGYRNGCRVRAGDGPWWAWTGAAWQRSL